MIIRFKNKMMLALQSMVEQANKVGGIPSLIELSPEEAKTLLDELTAFPAVLSAFQFKSNNQIVNFERLKKLSPINTESEIISQWKDKKVSVSYMRIDLVIVDVTTTNEKYHN